MKLCYSCKKVKSVDSFYKNKYHKDGLGSACKLCANKYVKEYHKKNPDKFKGYNKRWRSKNVYSKRRAKQAKLKCKYGITLEEYNQLFQQQNGHCAICGTHQSELVKTLAVDHDHKTGKVRGLLCMRCNLDLRVVENKNFIKKAEYYLTR